MVKGRKTPRLSFIALLVLCLPTFAGHSYKELRPSSNYWDGARRKAPVHITRLSGNRKLASVGDTVYMLDARNRIVWTWSSHGPPLTDVPIVDSKGIIYVIGYDLIWLALDSATGKEKWRADRNGRAVFSQIESYQRDKYLVVTDMEGYRESLKDRTIEDYLTLCKGDSILWETRIPAQTRIEVYGNRVVAVLNRKGSTRRTPIAIPHKLGAPTRVATIPRG